jgi:hypothetical protein
MKVYALVRYAFRKRIIGSTPPTHMATDAPSRRVIPKWPIYTSHRAVPAIETSNVYGKMRFVRRRRRTIFASGSYSCEAGGMGGATLLRNGVVIARIGVGTPETRGVLEAIDACKKEGETR